MTRTPSLLSRQFALSAIKQNYRPAPGMAWLIAVPDKENKFSHWILDAKFACVGGVVTLSINLEVVNFVR